MHSPLRLILATLLFLAISLAIFTTGRLMYFAVTPLNPDNKEETIVEIHKGRSPKEISKDLAARGIIEDAKSFLWVGRITRQWKNIKAGEYKISRAMTPVEIFSVMTSGISIAHPLTVREGENVYEIAADFEAKGLGKKEQFLELCRNEKFISSLGLNLPRGAPLEGYLFPETYFFNRTQTAEDMVRQMVRHFQSVWTAEKDARARALGFTKHQMITLASMIEKETGAPQERPIISSVFHNRLRKGMKLQSDPTTIYGMWEEYEGKIRRSDLLRENPYNTYTLPALPVGPIGNPGKEALEAALHPAETEFLYFVSHNDGTHEFTRSLVDHNKAVTKFQLDPKAREGKSWRDLTRKNKGAAVKPVAQ